MQQRRQDRARPTQSERPFGGQGVADRVQNRQPQRPKDEPEQLDEEFLDDDLDDS